MVTQEEIDCRLASAELRGEANAKREMAKAMLAKDIPLATISEISGLSADEIRAL